MRLFVTGLFILISLACFAQDFTKEINEQVWKPFIFSFDSYDTKTFMSLHSKDLIRSPRDSKAVLNWEEYLKNQEKSDTKGKEGGVNREIQLRFTERISNSAQAIDVGIYKTTVSTSDGKSAAHSYYGRFHVVLRKEGSVWKILVDTDSTEGNKIGEKDFMAARAIE